jgi:hypothetical protein
MPSVRQRSILSNLKSVSRETGALLNTLSTVSEVLSARRSETLIGTLGGVLGAICGLALSGNVQMLASQGVCLTLGTALGITLATVIWRGPLNMLRERRDRRVERLFLEHQDFVEDQIKKLGKSCPPELIEYHRQMPMQFIQQRAGVSPNYVPALPPPHDPLLLSVQRTDG